MIKPELLEPAYIERWITISKVKIPYLFIKSRLEKNKIFN